MIPDEVFNFIANNVTENVRDLEGILVSLMANAVINNREIDLPLTKRVVSQAVRLEKKQISVQMIQEIVCKYFNLEQSVIQTNSVNVRSCKPVRSRCIWRRNIRTPLFPILERS